MCLVYTGTNKELETHVPPPTQSHSLNCHSHLAVLQVSRSMFKKEGLGGGEREEERRNGEGGREGERKGGKERKRRKGKEKEMKTYCVQTSISLPNL